MTTVSKSPGLRLLAQLLAIAALAFAWGSAANARPYNTSSEGGESRLMLRGFDPVAYFTQATHLRGRPEFRSEHDGVVYRFASAEHKAMFDREPARYAPQYGGFCTNGIAYGIPWGGDPDVWTIADGKLYIFGGEASKRYFMMDEKKNYALAAKYWADEVEGSIGIVQRYWRLVFRVPHYKTGQQLEDEYRQRMRGGQPRGG